MGTVTITGVSPDPNIFATLALATNHIGAAYGPAATKWRAIASQDDKNRTLVQSYRFLSTLGLVESDGSAITEATTNADIIAAQAELAMLIALDPTVVDAMDAGSNIKVLDADGTKIEFFRPTSAANGTATRFPVQVQRLIAQYLPSTDLVIAGGASFGTDQGSWFDDCDDGERSGSF